MDANIFELDMYFWLCMILLAIIIRDRLTKPEISVKRALKYLKKSLVRLIVFYQKQYTASDQIVLIRKWFDNFDTKEVPKEQLKLFKEFIKNL